MFSISNQQLFCLVVDLVQPAEADVAEGTADAGNDDHKKKGVRGVEHDPDPDIWATPPSKF